jgi:HlyD family secretion protein
MASTKKSKSLFIYLAVAAAIVILALVSVFGKSKEIVKEIEAVKVEATTLAREVSANGTIETKSKANVISSVSGTVSRIFFSEGDRVRKNTIIALLDKEKFLVQYKEALSSLASLRRNIKGELLELRTTYARAKTSLEQARRSYESVKSLHEIGSASDEQFAGAKDTLEVAESSFTSALQKLNFREGRQLDDSRNENAADDDRIIENSAEVKQAAAALQSIDSNLKDCELDSPIDGVIIDLPIETGSVVAPGTTIAVVNDQSSLEITANIDEVDIGYLTIGQDVRIESDAFIDKSLKGKVEKIAPVIKKTGDSRVCEIKIGIIDPEKIAKIGASCSIYIETQHKENAPSIPIEVYVQESGKKFAWKLSAGTVPGTFNLTKTEIQTGIIGLEKVEIVKGLVTGDQVAKGDLKSFINGQKVKIKQAVKETKGKT